MNNNDTINYFCVTALEDNVTITSDGIISYKINDNDWQTLNIDETLSIPNLGDKVYIHKNDKNDEYISYWEEGWPVSLIIEGPVDVSGNIMSLIYSEDFEKNLTVIESAFENYFSYSDIIHSHDLILPATTLADYCYSSMFYNCSSLASAPELPATTLAKYCYANMFEGCSSLTTAPELPATALAERCYYNMFSNCDSLTTAPKLPATTLANICYNGMFRYCASLTSAPELPATTLTNACYSSMFAGCTSLTKAPELPATTLADYCYSSMFYNCSSLASAPELPATTLADYCYENMFRYCTSLTSAPELLATTLVYNCCEKMFANCTNLTDSPALLCETIFGECYVNMFSGCTNLRTITFAATALTRANTSMALDNWVANVSSTGTFYKNSKLKVGETTYYYNSIIGSGATTNYNGIPYGWKIIDMDQIPFTFKNITYGSVVENKIEKVSGRNSIKYDLYGSNQTTTNEYTLTFTGFKCFNLFISSFYNNYGTGDHFKIYELDGKQEKCYIKSKYMGENIIDFKNIKNYDKIVFENLNENNTYTIKIIQYQRHDNLSIGGYTNTSIVIPLI